MKYKNKTIARALAKSTKGGKGPISKRPGYKKHSIKGYNQTNLSFKARIVRALADLTPGGKGPIKKRPAYRKYVK